MSADNYVGVIPTNDGEPVKWGVIPYGNASMLDEDCMYRGAIEGSYFDTRAEALVRAHDLVKEEYVVEYGVIELEPVPAEPCGYCYVCVHERGIVADDLDKCDGCGKVISTGEWRVLTGGKIYHNSCEPR